MKNRNFKKMNLDRARSEFDFNHKTKDANISMNSLNIGNNNRNSNFEQRIDPLK